tara:strand:+ start:282 stop:455 length:174 start_codon:yes stop_codon:yes gene_type:complete
MGWHKDQSVTHDLIRRYISHLIEKAGGLLGCRLGIYLVHGMWRPYGNPELLSGARRI